MKPIKIILCLLLFCLCSACKPSSSAPLTKVGTMMDTIITITLYENGSPALLEQAFALCASYETTFSRTDPQSEVYRLNHAGGKPTVVSQDLYTVLQTALTFSRMTDGAFDVSICPVVDLWNFSQTSPMMPSEEELAQALGKVNWNNIRTDRNTVQLLDGVQLDLGAIAKGYAADGICDFLIEQGVTSAIVDLGGNVKTVGVRPDGQPFQVGIQKPFEERNTTIGIIDVAGQSVVSSGVYERFFRLEDRLYHHILDPKTGYPVQTDLLSVTVVSEDSMMGDALSTSLMMLGLERGRALAEEMGVHAVFVEQTGQLHFTAGFVEALHYQAAE